jgi:hypothetical protein
MEIYKSTPLNVLKQELILRTSTHKHGSNSTSTLEMQDLSQMISTTMDTFRACSLQPESIYFSILYVWLVVEQKIIRSDVTSFRTRSTTSEMSCNSRTILYVESLPSL